MTFSKPYQEEDRDPEGDGLCYECADKGGINAEANQNHKKPDRKPGGAGKYSEDSGPSEKLIALKPTGCHGGDWRDRDEKQDQ